VQRSAFPNANAKWEDDATALVQQLAGTLAGCAPAAAGGWVVPVDGPVVSGFRTPQRPGHHGIDIAAPKGTIIRAAAAGTVTLVACNASLNQRPYACDVDGSPAVKGCGWYTEIRHPGPITTRYCHLLHRPSVTVGQQVTAGQPIGVVGTSGHSTGPTCTGRLTKATRQPNPTPSTPPTSSAAWASHWKPRSQNVGSR
jgi:murein DD-endopeptidase MepM/ murein hydrolase activator NlpD